MASRYARQRRNTRHATKSRVGSHKWDITAVKRQSLRIAVQQSLITSSVRGQSVPQNPESGTDEDGDSPSSGSGSGEEEYVSEARANDARAQPDLSNGVPRGPPGWYGIRGIIAQRMRYYLVQWEGVDPATGNEWPLDFVSSSTYFPYDLVGAIEKAFDLMTNQQLRPQVHYSNLNGAALREWNSMHEAQELKRDASGTLTRDEARTPADIEEAWQRSLKQACQGL